MNTTYLLGLLLLAAIVIPIILLNRNNAKKNKLVQEQLRKMTETNVISTQESWNGYLIAIDEVNKKCFYIRREDFLCNSQNIDLTQFESCRVVTSSSLGSVSNSVELVELVFSPKNKADETKSVVFYSAEKDGFVLNGELQAAERWSKICNDCMKK